MLRRWEGAGRGGGSEKSLKSVASYLSGPWACPKLWCADSRRKLRYFDFKASTFSSIFPRFKEILDEGRVYNLSEEGGPKKALLQHQTTDNLRIIGKKLDPFENTPLFKKLDFWKTDIK